MTIAILEPFSGIAGDMMLGALVHVGLDPAWLRALPDRLGLDGVGVRIADVQRGMIACKKVDFDIPEQPHGRHIGEVRALLAAAPVPPSVRALADEAFTALASEEGRIHGVAMDEVHLHEVGAVDAILDVIGAIWGLSELGVSRVCCGTISLGDGFVKAAHGVLPVPAPATLRLLEGHTVRPGPDGAGELVTPTGAVLVKVLSSGRPPVRYIPRCSGYGAGTKDLLGRVNALRVTLADDATLADGRTERLVLLATDIDDMSPEHVAACADMLREGGALDVVVTGTLMKKGRAGQRLEVLAGEGDAPRLEDLLFLHTSTLGVRRSMVERRVLPRATRVVEVLGHTVRIKVATLPNGTQRSKPEFDDVRAVADATGRALGDVSSLALAAAERDR
ncbi:MAG TPA: nickel pincer cofactor biosynthesis protein LarC [Gemmatimonadaceae bacterium]|nr:nickel pincer cofactor biosynthesis protein LarC [Gemmatimonadaceae bacterium]HPV75184.1 nickel pincer cofactor biosynthesis protein LarC [Gemmatimonadaceae bacterium]